MVKDEKNSEVWYFTPTHIFGCHITREDRNIWKILMEQNEFSKALKITEVRHVCDMNDPTKQDIIKQHLAQYYLDNKKFNRSAELYAKTEAPFEQTCRKFFSLDPQFLLIYLATKLEGYQNKSIKELPRVYYRVVEYYDNRDILFSIASVLKDFEKIIRYHISNHEYFDAFQCLKSQNRPELWYLLSHEFFAIMPEKVVETWKEQRKILDPKRLVQSILHVSLTKPNTMASIISYLVYCIDELHLSEPFIHNYLVSLYCMSSDYEVVIKYLVNHSDHRILKACTFILCKMELFEEAVDLALAVVYVFDEVDIEHSKECAKRAPDKATQRKLWLIIATNTVKTQMDVDMAMKFLQEAQVLKFEDLLPFFGDFKKIDTFKDAICDSLKLYGEIVEKQKLEIEKLSQISDKMRLRNEAISKRSTHVEKASRCSMCGLTVLTKPFYAFPCGHAFHQICYIKTYFHLSHFGQKQQIFENIAEFNNEQVDSKVFLEPYIYREV
ncbi:Vacuolar protein sorting-associated protein 18 [Thelohanellus kitauei]|uniref:Vacuolar protein sorting-associated protein 18 n=1 Tax=Thelohanellus kitauei TaxID=669202 RepID=A0A0C2J3B4_THEKT|nr:Vacuolar protein sorting-associated protein 18 [Thelohanellus kitauei]